MLSEAIEAAYGDSYDVRWVYDTAEVSARLAAGTYVACVAETEDGELLCHEGMSLGAAGDAVGHSGQAVTMPAARGQHLFTRTKRFLMDWAHGEGAGGHVQRGDRGPPLQPARQHRARRARDRLPARLDPGLGLKRRRRTERRGRQSAALFYTKLNDGHERAGLRARAPPRDRRADPRSVRAEGHACRAACRRRAGGAQRAARRRRRGPQPGADHRARSGRRSGGGGRGGATPPLPPRLPRRDLPRPAAGSTRPPPSSPTISRRSASPTRASSPTAAATATCCACSPCTVPGSRPTTSPSPPSTAASCSSTSSPTCT